MSRKKIFLASNPGTAFSAFPAWFLGGYGVEPFLSTGNTTLSPNANDEVTAWLFYLPFGITIRTCSIDLITASTAANINAYFGLYDINKNLVIGSQATFAVGVGQTLGLRTFNYIAPVTIPEGWYYFVGSCDDNLATFGGITNINSGIIGLIMSSGTARVGRAANGVVGGTLPATLGVITAATGAGVTPACGFYS